MIDLFVLLTNNLFISLASTMALGDGKVGLSDGQSITLDQTEIYQQFDWIHYHKFCTDGSWFMIDFTVNYLH